MPDYLEVLLASYSILFFAALSVFHSQLIFAASEAAFPLAPHAELTPGSLCDTPNARRYAEEIPYCNRNVSSATKQQIMRTYDQTLGYQILTLDRAQFKIDHYIPLCMGGSNKVDNLWPQHASVYSKTDAIEATACEKMSAGRLRQVEAVEYIRRAKADIRQADEILRSVQKI